MAPAQPSLSNFPARPHVTDSSCHPPHCHQWSQGCLRLAAGANPPAVGAQEALSHAAPWLVSTALIDLGPRLRPWPAGSNSYTSQLQSGWRISNETPQKWRNILAHRTFFLRCKFVVGLPTFFAPVYLPTPCQLLFWWFSSLNTSFFLLDRIRVSDVQCFCYGCVQRSSIWRFYLGDGRLPFFLEQIVYLADFIIFLTQFPHLGIFPRQNNILGVFFEGD